VATSDIPATLLILLPGFVALQTFRLVSPRRHLSDFETALWSLAVAFAILAPTTTAWHRIDSDVPSLAALVRQPASVPTRLAVALYAVAPLAGWGLGHLDRSRRLEQLAQAVRVDLTRRRDVWFVVFRDPYYVLVYLKSGALLYGWPERFSTDRTGEATELYLTNTRVWKPEVDDWVEHVGIAGVWIDASSIERIEFTKEPASPPVNSCDGQFKPSEEQRVM
jgi:hypothetical protein